MPVFAPGKGQGKIFQVMPGYAANSAALEGRQPVTANADHAFVTVPPPYALPVR
jgi:hypothetical protein